MSRVSRLSVSLVIVVAVALPAAVPRPAMAGVPTTYTIDTTSDAALSGCTAIEADCSLRGAITAANGNMATTDTINFNIPAATDPGCDSVSGVCTISPATDLPAATDPVVIDGLSQPGAAAGSLKIQLTGPEDPADSVGLRLNGGGSTLQGLVVNHFDTGIYLAVAGGNTVRSNYVGTDPAGAAANGNVTAGLLIAFSAGSNVIGGAGPGEGNVLSGNQGYGLSIFISTADIVQGNLIGTNAAGTQAMPNALGGIRIGNAAGTVIGGAGAGARNVISGNSGAGIYGAGGSGPAVQGNLIGVGTDGTTPLGNSGGGIFDNGGTAFTIGGTAPGEGNVIAFNGLAGGDPEGGIILPIVLNPVPIPIEGNRIYSNDGLGIDLGLPGPQPNDTGDGDDGPNGLQNYPIVTEAATTSGTTTIRGTLDSTPSTSFRVEFFHSSGCDPSGFGEGEAFAGAIQVTTDANGDATFSAPVPAITPTRQVTATATDPLGNTSEFSECAVVTIGVLKGDVDCSGGNNAVNAVDALKVLRFSASLTVTQNEPCPDIGTTLSPGVEMGDMNCDGNENSVDALLLLRHNASLPVNLPEGCAPIGS